MQNRSSENAEDFSISTIQKELGIVKKDDLYQRLAPQKIEERSAGRLSSSIKKTQGTTGQTLSSISTIQKESGIVKKTEISKKKYKRHNSLNKKAPNNTLGAVMDFM